MPLRKALFILLPLILAACKGGGGGGGGGDDDETPQPNQPQPILEANLRLTPANISEAAEAFRREVSTAMIFYDISTNIHESKLPAFNRKNFTKTVNCSWSGDQTLSIKNNGASARQDFNQCITDSDGVAINGSIYFDFSNVSQSARSYDLVINYNNFEVGTTQRYRSVTGSAAYTIRTTDTDRISADIVTSSEHTFSDIDFPIISRQLSFSLEQDDSTDYQQVNDVNGQISLFDNELVTYSWIADEQHVEISGSTEAKGYVTPENRYVLKYISSTGDISAIAVDDYNIGNIYAFANINSAPIAYEYPGRVQQFNPDDDIHIELENWLYDPDFDVLNLSISVSESPLGSTYSVIEEDDFSILFTPHNVGRYVISVEGTDPDGASVEAEIPLEIVPFVDTDNDGLSDVYEIDKDDDGVIDTNDAFPLNPSETVDSDNDGIGNNQDTDDDNDGVLDDNDAFPLNQYESLDTDNDGIGNYNDLDDDGDGVLDTVDDFPLNPSESYDTDGDGIGDNVDTDDDNDGVPDDEDAFPLSNGETLDTDGDGYGNNSDIDDDNDGINDNEDAFPLDSSESLDTDNDSIGNNTDPDDDNDGVADSDDAFPLNPLCQSTEQAVGNKCLYASITPDTKEINVGSDGVFYFLIEESKAVVRWDSRSETFLKTWYLGSLVPSEADVVEMAYQENHERLYFGYSQGTVTYLNLSSPDSGEHFFATIPTDGKQSSSVGNIFGFDKYLLVLGSPDETSAHYYFNNEGSIVGRNEDGKYSSNFAWSNFYNRVYFVSELSEPNDIYYEEINIDSGDIISVYQPPFQGNIVQEPPVLISPNEQKIFAGTMFYNAHDLRITQFTGHHYEYAHWLANGNILTFQKMLDKTYLNTLDNQMRHIKQEIYDGDAVGIFEYSGTVFLILNVNGNVSFTKYGS